MEESTDGWGHASTQESESQLVQVACDRVPWCNFNQFRTLIDASIEGEWTTRPKSIYGGAAGEGGSPRARFAPDACLTER
jgi:hypothetical protein